MKPGNLEGIINKKRYRTENSILLASDAYWDGKNWERQGRNQFLFKTFNGNYFMQYQSHMQGERDYIEPVSQDEAIAKYEELPEKESHLKRHFQE